MGSCRVRNVAFFTILLVSLLHSMSGAVELDVGGDEGWVVPKAGDALFYNHWASDNRFVVGDSVRFRYKKDSVMVVETEEEYEDCKSQHPVFFSNNGDTTYKLHRSGTFYFISGAAGHCDKGQKMIVRVLARSEPPAGTPPFNRTRDVTSLGSSVSSRRGAVASAAGMVGSMMAPLLLF